MSRRSAHIETDRHGRQRLVIGGDRRRSPEPRNTGNEDLLISEIESLRTRLSFAESNEHRIRNQYQALANEHYQCRNLRGQLQALENDIGRIQDKYEDEQDKNERLEERIRLMRRSSVESYRQRYEEKVAEAEALRRKVLEQDGYIRVQQTRIAARDQSISKKTSAIIYFKEYLRGLGYVVEMPA